MSDADVTNLRDLAQKYMEICNEPVQAQRRNLWREHNSFNFSRPPIYVRAFGWQEMPQSKLQCQDVFWQEYENFFRESIFRSTFDDDFIFEPWLAVNAVYKCTGWGVSGERNYSDEVKGSFKCDYPIKKLEDFAKLRKPWHEIDEAKTAEKLERVTAALGDVITINLDRAPAYRMWTGDLSTELGYLRGIEHVMMDMVVNPDWLHEVMAFLRDGVLKTHDQAEEKGDWGLSAHQNQAMSYAKELQDPQANINGVKRNRLWYYMAAQELTGVSPQHHEEFMLKYQLPILKKFGLVAYGCCEDLTRKIDMLRQIPNLRRIAVSPFADVAKCAQQIGRDYIISYRPSPADMVSYQFDADSVKGKLREDFAALKDTCFDITLKDVETVEGDPQRIKLWVQSVREVIEEIF